MHKNYYQRISPTEISGPWTQRPRTPRLCYVNLMMEKQKKKVMIVIFLYFKTRAGAKTLPGPWALPLHLNHGNEIRESIRNVKHRKSIINVFNNKHLDLTQINEFIYCTASHIAADCTVLALTEYFWIDITTG